MENNKTIIKECEAIKSFNNFKKFYNAFRKINNLKIEKKLILDFLKQLLELEYYEYSQNQFKIFPNDFKLQFIRKCQGNEMETMKIYKTYFKEHVGHKFIDFLILSVDVGYFEMQMNVVSSDILINAKENPKNFPNLIVRVWGFSSYFNDLTEEYKNLLIERALKSEGKSY